MEGGVDMRVCTGEERGGGWEPGVYMYINLEREREREREEKRREEIETEREKRRDRNRVREGSRQRQTVESTERNIYKYVYMHREKDGGKIQRVHG